MNNVELEKRRLAIINLTIEEPGIYRVMELARWSGLSVTAVRTLDSLVGLDLKRGHFGGKWFINKRLIKEPLKDYFTCGKPKSDSTRKKIEIYVSMAEREDRCVAEASEAV